MRPPLDGTVLVTGASSGIGREIARQLAGTSRRLILVARRRERLEALRDELLAAHPGADVEVRPCDLSDLSAIDALLGDLGDVDVLVNNAGRGDVGFFEDADWDELACMIQLNVTSLTYLAHRLVPGMVARGRGGLLNISSGFGLTFMPGFAAYAGSKHYVTAFTESLRTELAGTGVVVTQVCPGPVRTEFLDVAGNPTGQEVPGFVEISAEQCARASLRGFRRGRALVQPGLAASALIWTGRMTPRAMLRAIYGPLGRWLRARR